MLADHVKLEVNNGRTNVQLVSTNNSRQVEVFVYRFVSLDDIRVTSSVANKRYKCQTPADPV